MKTILLVASAIFLSSCRSIPDPNRKLVVEQCGITFIFDEDGSINQDDSICECRDYEYSLNKLGSVSVPELKPISYCNKLIGNKPKNYLELTNFLGDIRRDVIDNMSDEQN